MRARKTKPKIVIIAGPNGAGKTTFAREFLPREAECPEFINADLIASGLSPFAPENAAMAAGRIMLEQIAAKIASRSSFAFVSREAHLPRPALGRSGCREGPDACCARRALSTRGCGASEI
jgi:hypothetical protein